MAQPGCTAMVDLTATTTTTTGGTVNSSSAWMRVSLDHAAVDDERPPETNSDTNEPTTLTPHDGSNF